MTRHYSKIDSKTKYELILSDCSYNVAMDWLQKDMAKYNVEVYKSEYDTERKLVVLYAGKFSYILNDYRLIRKFYYDDERGYLLGE